MKIQNAFIIIFLCICFFIFGVLSEKLFFNKYFSENKSDNNNPYRSLTTERKFTNPLLDCNPNFSYINPVLEDVIIKKIDELNKKPSIEKVSVYLRFLNNGAWFGINEKEKFIPASLNKVPLMIAVFKFSETHPDILDNTFLFDETLGVFNETTPSNTVTNQKKYTLLEVVEYMIKHSHNETAELLYNLINKYDNTFVGQVFLDLGIDAPQQGKTYQITTKDFASFFRVLYNSTYINEKNSETALYYLSETDFNDGIVKGIDDNIVISHKYGQISDNKLMQLHDCGIIYFPDNNYILCVMVKGYNLKNMTTVIQEVSKTIYAEIKRQKTDK